MTLVVYLASALLCADGQCYPALVGADTPLGHFDVHRRYVEAEGYGGDVLQFKETASTVYAIHRVWLGRPQEHRLERLASPDAAVRRAITGGCINVAPDVYERISQADAVEIRP